MSTRANIYVFDTEFGPSEEGIWFYRHSDGYPDGAMCSLLKFMKWLNDGLIRDNVGQGAPWIIAIGMEEYHGGAKPYKPRNPITRPENDAYGGWKIGAIELTTEMHSDIEYYYEINLTKKTLTAYEVFHDQYYKGKKINWTQISKRKIPYDDLTTKVRKKKLFTVTPENINEHIVKYCENETFSAPTPAPSNNFSSGYGDVMNRFAPRPKCIEWSKYIDWSPRLCIKADTYVAPELFDTPPVMQRSIDANTFDDGTYVDSPSHRFRYANLNLPADTKLTIMKGWSKGYVEFDGDVIIPALFERKKGSKKFMQDPWMSITPNELITLRPGTEIAKGVVVIGGLGLGHQLIEVCKKDSVTDVILVEWSKELVNWLLPIIKKDNPIVESKLSKVIVGDAHVEIPKLTADVALIDIYPGYGDQTDDQEMFEMKSSNIDIIWLWQAGKDEEWEWAAPKDKKITKKKKKILIAVAVATLAVAGFLTYNSESVRRKFGWPAIYNPSQAYHQYIKWREQQ